MRLQDYPKIESELEKFQTDRFGAGAYNPAYIVTGPLPILPAKRQDLALWVHRCGELDEAYGLCLLYVAVLVDRSNPPQIYPLRNHASHRFTDSACQALPLPPGAPRGNRCENRQDRIF